MRAGAIFVVMTALCGVARAQEVGPAEAIRDARAASDRLEREWACLRAKQQELGRVVALMGEAQVQMSRTAAGTQAHTDARDAIRSLRQRAIRVEREALACRAEPSAEARSDAPPEGLVVRTVPQSPAERAVAERNPATRVIERDAVLQRNVKAVVGEQVDGRGTVEASVVRAAVRGIAPQLGRCYDRMVERGALQRGTIILAFTIEPSGRVTRIRTEQNSFRNQAFDRCVRTAGRAIRPSSGATGGDATVSYTLQFPSS